MARLPDTDEDRLVRIAQLQGNRQMIVTWRLRLLGRLRRLQAEYPWWKRDAYHQGQRDLLNALIVELDEIEQGLVR